MASKKDKARKANARHQAEQARRDSEKMINRLLRSQRYGGVKA